MNAFVDNVKNQEARTENGMKALRSTGSAVVDLFYKIGASRGKDIIPAFVAAYVEDKELALRVALWARDVRGGAGERQIFRDILKYLEENDPDSAFLLMNKTPELGRWDDLLVLEGQMRTQALSMYTAGLKAGDGLAAKWAPRKGPVALALRQHMGLSPKQYRRLVVDNTKVVETQMCAKQWDDINFSHVPSRAASIYKKAFARHTPKYAAWLEELKEPKEERDPKVKINAGAIFPHDVLKDLFNNRFLYHYHSEEPISGYDIDTIRAQWEALPDFMNDKSALAVVDVSGSMVCPAGEDTKVTCLQVAVSLGLYMADKAKSAFKDTFLTFSGNPELVTLKGDIVQKVHQISSSHWAMNTNLHACFAKILNHAIQFKVSAEDMPEMLVILSDMQFDNCVRYDDSAIEMIRRKYSEAGYKVPQIVFWNINARNNAPVKMNERGVALASGYSQNLLKAILSVDEESFSPESMMMKVIMSERYNLG